MPRADGGARRAPGGRCSSSRTSMPAVAQLCDRAILIDGGRIVGDGPSAEVDRQLPAPTHGAGSERAWPDGVGAGQRPRPDPRDPRSSTHDGEPPGVVDVRRPVGIEIDVHGAARRQAASSRRSRCSTRRARSPSTRWTPTSAGYEPSPPGEYVATAWIPGNLLNEGSAIVEVGGLQPRLPEARAPRRGHEAVSFEVLDPGEGDSARGRFTGQWRGVVRPLLEWTVEKRSIT